MLLISPAHKPRRISHRTGYGEVPTAKARFVPGFGHSARALMVLLLLLFIALSPVPGGLSTAVAQGQQPQVSLRVTISPKEVQMGGRANLVVSVEGTTAGGMIEVPVVDGLKIEQVGKSTQVHITNGVRSDTQEIRYIVRPMREGDFTIPSITVKTGPSTVRSPAVNLRVTPAARSASRLTIPNSSLPASPGTSGTAAAPRASPSTPSLSPSGQAKEALVELVLPRLEFFVGELVPVALKLYASATNHRTIRSLNALPSLTSDAFSLTKLSPNPMRSLENVGNLTYNVYTWDTSLSPVKAGDFELGVQADLQLVVRTSHPIGPDADPRFTSIQQRLEDKTFKSVTQKVRVLPLPTAGRPTTFNGAVGQFQVSATASPARVSVGEPVMLKFEVWGTGNFDRVSVPVATETDGWKIYPASAKPQVDEATATTGRKIFEMHVVPTRGGLPGLMPFTFSYFDPKARKFVSLDVVMPRITILGETAPKSGTPINPSRAGDASETSDVVDPLGLAPQRVMLSPFVASLRPIALDPYFAAAQLFPLAFFVLSFAMGRRRMRMMDTGYTRTLAARQSYRSHLRAMDAAVQSNESTSFFTHAKAALQLQLAERWKMKPGDISLDLVEERDPAIAGEIRVVFEKADELAYAGQAGDAQSLEEWHRMVMTQLEWLQ